MFGWGNLNQKQVWGNNDQELGLASSVRRLARWGRTSKGLWEGTVSEVAGKWKECGAQRSSKEKALRKTDRSTVSTVQIIKVKLEVRTDLWI